MASVFEKMHPGTKVEIYRSGTGIVSAKLQAEIQAGAVKADMIWFADMAQFQDLAKKGLLLKYNSPEAAYIPEKFVYLDGMAYEVRLIYQIVAYNTLKVKEKVRGWADLLNPAYKGRVGSASALYSGATLTQVATLVSDPDFGWDFYEKLRRNGCKIVKGNGAVARNVATGEYFIGLTIDFMARDLIEKGSPVDYVYQEEGTVYIPTPMGIMNSTKNPDVAKAFVDFALSEEGQKLMMKQGYVPVSEKIEPPQGVPSPRDIKILTTDWDFLRKNRGELKEKWAEMMAVKVE